MNSDRTEDFTPRDYQVNLYNAALRENTIVYLPTGAGKTFVAVLLIRARSDELLKPLDDSGKRTVFLVPTEVLARQQSEYIRRHVNLNVGVYYGTNQTDCWHSSRWTTEFEQRHVLVMTAQIFCDILDHNFFLMGKVNLLIMDECHRAVGDAPMAQILRKMDQCDRTTPPPRILGLTAALFCKKCAPHQVDKHVNELERTLKAKVRTASISHGSSVYSARPKMCLVRSPSSHSGIEDRFACEDLEEILSKIVQEGLTASETFFKTRNAETYAADRIKDPVNVFKELTALMNTFGPWGVCHGAQIFQKYLKRRYLRAVHSDFKQHLSAVQEKLNSLEDAFVSFSAKYSDSEVLRVFTKPRLSHLLEVIRLRQKELGLLPERNPLCCLVFVERRSSANVLYHFVQAASKTYPDLSFLRPLFIMGTSGNPTMRIPEHSILEIKQKEIMERFHDGLCNVLISTSVLEEGIDVRACNLVVRFDPVRTYCDFVQAKGRARARNASYVLMEDERNLVLEETLRQFSLIENILQTKYGDDPDFDEGEDNLELEEDVLPPYMPFGPLGPRITATNAISVLNRYCGSLPSDRFSPLAPEWNITQAVDCGSASTLANKYSSSHLSTFGMFGCSLRLPLNSPLREEIVSPPMPSKLYAKRAVAMATCIKLHQMKELSDDHLLPITRDLQLVHDDDVQFQEEEVNPGEAKPGTRKRCQQYVKQVADELEDCSPKPNQCCLLYEIHIRKDSASSEAVFPVRSLAVLSAKELPVVVEFPLYTRLGKVLVSFRLCSATLSLTEAQFGQTEAFHRYLFHDVLKLSNSDTIYDAENHHVGLLVAPVKKDLGGISLDFAIMDRVLNADPQGVPGVPASGAFEDTVVTALHRDPLELFYVEEVTELTPVSPFPHPQHKDYVHYYSTVYGIKILNLEQPLLRVERVASTASYLTPRAVKAKEKNIIHLVPQLCAVHPLPASLWSQAVLLPAALYRLNGLLMAEKLRSRVVLEANLGSLIVDACFDTWPEMDSARKQDQIVQPPSTPAETSRSSRVLGPRFVVRENAAEAADEGPVVSEKLPDVTERFLELAMDYTWIVDLHKVEDSVQNHPTIDCMEDLLLSDDVRDNNFAQVRVPGPSVKFDEHPGNSKVGPCSAQILQAITGISANEDINLERLEVIGDSFLKLAVSVYLFTEKRNSMNEGHLTMLRTRKICNRTLYYIGKKMGLPQMLRMERFLPKSNWTPPLYRVDSSENSRIVQKVSDKSIADSVEALIGVYLLTTGTNGALKFIQWAGLRVLPDNEMDSHSSGFVGNPPSPIVSNVPNVGSIVNDLLGDVEPFEARINYRFKEKAYLLQAFSHPSFSQNRVTDCYQRLEFLGDALLDYLVTRHIYNGAIKLSPGALTDLRSSLVNNATFACLAVRYGFHSLLKHMSVTLIRAIDGFVSKQECNGHRVLDDYLLIEKESDDEFATDVEVPKVLGDLFESVAGAIFLDSGMSMDAVWNVYYPLMKQELDEFSTCVPRSPLRELYEMEPERIKFQKPVILNDGRVSVIVDVASKGSFRGVGRNSALAKCTAAKFALKSLKRENPREFCDEAEL